MRGLPVRRGLAAVLLALAVVGGATACTDTEETDDDAPSQQVPEQPEQPEQDDD